MAADLIVFNANTDLGRTLVNGLKGIRDGRNTIQNLVNAMTRTINGDGSQATQFALTVTEFGFEAGGYADANTAAQASWNELNSFLNAISQTNGSVANPGTAITQCCAKHGV